MSCKENVGFISLVSHPTEHLLWTIPNTFYENDVTDITGVTSPLFSFSGDQWQLILMPKKCNFALFLWNLNLSRRRYRVKLDIQNNIRKSFLKSYCCKLESHGHFGTWSFITPMDYDTMAKWPRHLDMNGFLTFYCEIQRVEEVEATEGLPILNSGDEEVKNEEVNVEESVPEARGTKRLVQDLKNLFTSGQSKDVVLKTDDCEFAAHKAILGARSPVFASMFQHDMAEKTTGFVDIPDCPADAFRVFLLHAYTGTASGLSNQNVLNVYYASDKYQVNDLKEDCVKFMEDNLSVDTFCDVIGLSLRHGESGLQKVATRFFCNNVKKILKTTLWQKYVQGNPIQANELYIKAMNA